MKALLLCLLLIMGAQSISKYDFNACRISSCNTEELNCLAEQSGCLNYFGIMRNCFAQCTGVYDNFNPCWQNCKNTAARSNTHWYSLSLCYENVCYVHQQWLTLLLCLVLFLSLL